MRSYIYGLLGVLTFVAIVWATSRDSKQGEFVTFGGTTAYDTLKSNDTAIYVMFNEHTNSVSPYVNILFDKTGTADTTIRVTINQSMDGVNYLPVLAGASQSAYAKTISYTSDTRTQWSFITDTANFEGRYLQFVFISKPKTGYKMRLSGSVKFNIK